MAKGNRADIVWADQDAYRHYLVSWGERTQGDEHVPFGLASMSEIVDKFADQAFQDAIGEPCPDVVSVWRLTDKGPVEVDVTFHGHVINGEASTQVDFTWVDRFYGHPNNKRTESAFYRTPEA